MHECRRNTGALGDIGDRHLGVSDIDDALTTASRISALR